MFNSIKERFSKLFKSRLSVLIVVFTCMFLGLIGRVFYLQIIKGQYYLDNFKLQILKTQDVPGTRGNIYDRNGELLAYNELAYSITIEDDIPLSSEKNKILNKILDEVLKIAESNGDTVVSDFGVVLNSADQYEFLNQNETLRLRFIADVYGCRTVEDLTEEQKNSTAEDIIKYLCTDKSFGYGLDIKKFPKDYILKMVNMRYAISLNSYQKYIPAVLAKDVSEETVVAIMENKDHLKGVDIAEDSMRRYANGPAFASILGYTGTISQDEYDELEKSEKKKYSLTDSVGKAGLEQTLESTLKGKKGQKKYYVDSVGKVTKILDSIDPESGNDAYLTIDKKLQEQTYNILEEHLAGIILLKLRNVMNYDPANESDASNIIIPVDDAYNAFIANEIIDFRHFQVAEAGAVEKTVNEIFQAYKKNTIPVVLNELKKQDAAEQKNLSNDMKEYMLYVYKDVMLDNAEILIRDKIDTDDEVYKAWYTEGSISLRKFLEHAISKDWIDTAKLDKYIPRGKYHDSEEIFDGIIAFLENYLNSDSKFDKLLYKYLIKLGSITGGQICAITYEQGVLPMDEGAYKGLADGSLSSYDWLREKIRTLQITPGQLALEPCTASAVVSDPNTGQVLVCVSYPGYDNNRLANTMDTKYYNQLVTGLSRPFYNNATQERTAPGSTFKMLVSIAGLSEHVIDGGTQFVCNGKYDKVTPNPKCWVYPGAHGYQDVVGALQVSCNCFFYEVGHQLGTDENGKFDSDLGVERIKKYAKKFGLDQKSGIEIPESEPQISDEYAVLSAIGQGTNNYTVSQLDRYVAAIANKGTLYNLTLLNKITDVNGKVIKEFQPVVANVIDDIDPSSWNLVHSGMKAMVDSTLLFNNMGISMAGKTGTAQQSRVHPDHGLFVGFAPVDNPEISLAVRIANGYSSMYAAEIGRDIVRAKFNLAEEDKIIRGEASTIGNVISGD